MWQVTGAAVLALQVMVLYSLNDELSTDACVPSSTDNNSWYAGMPLCCLYAGATLAETFTLAGLVLEKKRAKTTCHQQIMFLALFACIEFMYVFSIYIIALIMMESTDLKSLISDFIGISVVLQCDALLAQVIKITVSVGGALQQERDCS